MRPKKNILLYCADVVAAEEMKFLLEVRNMLLRVTAVSSAESLMRTGSADGADFECIVIYRSELGRRPHIECEAGMDVAVFRLLEEAKTRIRMIEIANGGVASGHTCITRVLDGKMPYIFPDLMEAVKMACARKRGPGADKEARRGFLLPAARTA